MLRNETLKDSESYSPKTWPPNVEDLTNDELKPPDSVTYVLEWILKPSGNHTPNINPLAYCILQDIILNILGQKTALQKHFLFDIGIAQLSWLQNSH